MADLTNILGKEWSPPVQVFDTPENQLRDAIIRAGLEPPDYIQIDGALHRFKSGTKGTPGQGDKSGWYIAFNDGVPAGRFGCWRAGHEQSWVANVGRQLTVAEQMAQTRRMTDAKRIRDEERKKQQENVAETVETIWSNGLGASPDHPYLQTKGIQPHGARVDSAGRLMTPLYSDDGALSSLQYINDTGRKLFHTGGATSGKFWIIGEVGHSLYIAEGYATAATIYECTGQACAIAYSASNVVHVARFMRERYGIAQNIVIVGDNDESGTGQKYAEQAATEIGARLIIPPIVGDANDYAQAGHDLAGLLNPPSDDDEWLIHADEFSQQPAPIKWLVKDWVQDQAFIMVHGPSGGGKTFFVLDIANTIASGLGKWKGHKVTPGTVVYLAGEGHHGLRSRIAAWKQYNQVSQMNMYVSRHGCDLNTSEGYHKVLESVRKLPETPRLIVIDTLHRFLKGDENSSEIAKTMIDACGLLMREFNTSVLLVHHTGKDENAQKDGRGSSAYRGALEIAISVVPATESTPIQIIQRKAKDSELAPDKHMRLEKVTINGWFDEDNEPVTSVVMVEEDAPVNSTKKSAKHTKNLKVMERAWWASGTEIRMDLPYITRSALRDLMRQDGKAEQTIKNAMNANNEGKMIASMLADGVIEAYENGFIVTDEVEASAWLLAV
jgi:phage/plasmid primase-like uncharacterized protein/KaiC/GvpD/RAD55 family RecA-like ATPase